MKVYLVIDTFCGTHIDDAVWGVFTTHNSAGEFIRVQPEGDHILEIIEHEVQE